VIEALLERGADPNAALKKPQLQRHHTPGDPALAEGATPFMRAAKAGDTAVMRLLLDWGADPLAAQANGTTPLIIAAGLGWRDGNMAIPTRDRGTESALIDAIKICLARGADLNAANADGTTALHAAAARAGNDIVKFLAAQGARLDARNKDGLTPLDIALGKHAGRGGPRRPHPETAAVLRQLMGTPDTADAEPATDDPR
jgi:ankyrin repeat protein